MWLDAKGRYVSADPGFGAEGKVERRLVAAAQVAVNHNIRSGDR
jgi:hypothetical protein